MIKSLLPGTWVRSPFYSRPLPPIEPDERPITGILLEVVRWIVEMVRLHLSMGEEVHKGILAYARAACGGQIVRTLSTQSTGDYEYGVNLALKGESQFGSQISANRTIFRLVVGLGGPVNSMV
jgi:hypothetical protein